MIFPSPGVNPYAKGLAFNHLPESVYERGSSRTNPLEARAVAEAVMHHAQAHPDLTLGVVAFSTAQRDCILLENRAVAASRSELRGIFHDGCARGLFCKKLGECAGG